MADSMAAPYAHSYHYVVEHGAHIACDISVTPHDKTLFDTQAAWVMGVLNPGYVSNRYVSGNAAVRCVVVLETPDGEFYIKHSKGRDGYAYLKLELGHAET